MNKQIYWRIVALFTVALAIFSWGAESVSAQRWQRRGGIISGPFKDKSIQNREWWSNGQLKYERSASVGPNVAAVGLRASTIQTLGSGFLESGGLELFKDQQEKIDKLEKDLKVAKGGFPDADGNLAPVPGVGVKPEVQPETDVPAAESVSDFKRKQDLAAARLRNKLDLEIELLGVEIKHKESEIEEAEKKIERLKEELKKLPDGP